MNNEQTLPTEHIAEGLQKAREYRGISQKDTAELLGISASVLRNYEKGKYLPSLPILESLSYIYHIPLGTLISPEALEDYTNQPDADQLQQLIKVRQNIISTTLQIALDESGLSQKDLVKASGVTRSKVRKYLDGEEIPLDDLKKISNALHVENTKHLDQDSQIGLWQATQAAYKKFADLPENIREFLSRSDSWDFIYSAYSLNSLNKEELETLSHAFGQLREIINSKG